MKILVFFLGGGEGRVLLEGGVVCSVWDGSLAGHYQHSFVLPAMADSEALLLRIFVKF